MARKTKAVIDKKVENCPITGKILRKKKFPNGQLVFKGGPYEHKGYKYTTIVYVSKV